MDNGSRCVIQLPQKRKPGSTSGNRVPIHILLAKSAFVNIFLFFFSGEIAVKTHRFALIGHPVGHSMSPFLHARLFALAGADAQYGMEDIPPENLAGAVPGLRALDGFNLTIPHKRAVIPLLDALDPKAAETGSVNTVKNDGGRLTGFTTDGEGFRLALENAGVPLAGNVVVLGAGGAARAVAFEAARAGARVTVASRQHSAEAAAALCADLRAKFPGARAESRLISHLRGSWDILVNTTPAGMYPHTESCAAPEELVASSACVFDAVYNPGETLLLAAARRLGKQAVGGVGMLVGQAAAAEGIWLGAHFSDGDFSRLCAETSLELRKKFGNVVLCGFMGSGKTTCGRLLAEETGRRFVDLDDFIERRAGRTVAEIFAQQGEAAFRDLEARAVRELSHMQGLVVAAGGGTLLQPENAAALRANGVIVLLDISLQTARERLKGDSARPLLHRDDGSDAVGDLYRARAERYRAAADLTAAADGAPQETVRAVRSLLTPS